MNHPSSPNERRGATAPPASVNSLVFFGGIILGVAVVATGALALWGPENEVERRRAEAGGSTTPSYASAAAAADSAALAAAQSAEAVPTVLPEAPAEPPPIELAAEPKKGAKKRGGRGKPPKKP